MNDPIVTYEELKNLEPEAYVVDVRDPEEIASTGSIPASINIPLPILHTVIQEMTNDQFVAEYGRTKPTKEDRIIFSCKSGGRAMRAANTLSALGYENVQYYKGSWTEWHAKSLKEKENKA